MSTCVSNDLLLDYLYGLLDEPEAQSLREHVAGCAACQVALKGATSEKTRIAHAARAISEVPLFRIPELEPDLDTSIAPASPPVPEPRSSPASSSRRFRPLVWLIGSMVAACLLVATILGYQHREHLNAQTEMVERLERRLVEIDGKLVASAGRIAGKVAVPEELAKDAVQMHLWGPAQVAPGVGAGLHIALRDADGKDRSGTVALEVLDDKSRTVALKQIAVAGDTTISLHGLIADRTGPVRVRASLPGTQGTSIARVEESVQVQGPSYTAHLTTSKQWYRAGDKVLIRALVLDRFTLKPPTAPFSVEVRLLHDDGRIAVPPLHLTAVQGMAAGEFPLPVPFGTGIYTVEVRGDHLATVSRRVEVVPATPATVELANSLDRVRAGGNVQQSLQMFDRAGNPAANQPYSISGGVYELRNNQQPASQNAAQIANRYQNIAPGQGGFNQRGQTDAQGRIQFSAPVPKDVQTGRAALVGDVQYGPPKKQEKVQISREFRVIPSKLLVDFHPEGGRLVAGVPNRVFYRVRAPLGDTVAPEGRVVVMAKSKVIFDSDREQEMGSFTFIPEPTEEYRVRITSPMQEEIRDPFAGIGIHHEGVLLRGAGVQDGGQPLRMTLENRGNERLVQVIASCRGQIVFHRRLSLGAEPVPVEIATKLDGIHRVTLLEVSGDRLLPLAERLVYREPAQRLDVAVKLDQTMLPSGKGQVHLQVNGKNEDGRAQSFWALASVVDDRLVGEQPEPSLQAHFLLLQDVPAESADLADLPLLAGPPTSHRGRLELVLGVLGGRFLPSETKREPRPAQDDRLAASTPSQPMTFFYRVQPSGEELRDQLKRRGEMTRQSLAQAARSEQAALTEERAGLTRQIDAARIALADLRERPRQTMLLAMGALALTLLCVGALCVGWGLARVLRGNSATGIFATALASIAACLVLVLARPEAMQDDSNASKSFTATAPKRQEPADPGVRAEVRTRIPAANSRIDLGIPSAEADKDAMAGAGGRGGAAPGFAPMRRADDVAAREGNVRDGTSTRVNTQPGQLRGVQEQLQQPDSRATIQRPRQLTLEGQAPVAPGGPVGGVAPRLTEAAAKRAKAPLGAGGAPGGAPPGPAAKLARSPAPPPATATPAPSTVSSMPRPAEDAEKANPALYRLLKKLDETKEQRVDLANLTRQLAVRRASDLADPTTLLWHPALAVPENGLPLSFDVPPGAGRYRLLLFGHTEDGRLGFLEDTLQVKDPPR